MALTVWKRCFGGPCCGRSFPFSPDEPFLPVSYDYPRQDVLEWRVGKALHDWEGTLAGHYYLDIDKYDGIERAKFLPLPESVKGLYTRYNPQADGDEDDGG